MSETNQILRDRETEPRKKKRRKKVPESSQQQNRKLPALLLFPFLSPFSNYPLDVLYLQGSQSLFFLLSKEKPKRGESLTKNKYELPKEQSQKSNMFCLCKPLLSQRLIFAS
jgi:hypothetical protein